jgi:hypothetical protein
MMVSIVLPEEVSLRNGLTVSVRPVIRDNEEAIWEFLTDLSIDSRRLRFFGVATDLRAQAHRGAAGDDAEHHGVLAIAPGRRVVGHAVYVRLPHSESGRGRTRS